MLRGAPGARATICGFVGFMHGGDYWRLSHLYVDGTCSTQNTVQVYANHATLDHLDITNRHRAQSCVMLGTPGDGRARYTILQHNRIHDCGRSDSHFYHGIYANSPRDARVSDNYVYANAGFGIHLYPDAQRTVVERNVVDGNFNESGLVFAGTGSSASSDNRVRRNIFSGNGAYGVAASWGGAVGHGNVVGANCFWGNAQGALPITHPGFEVGQNLDIAPAFVGSTVRDYRLRRGSRCRPMEPRGHVGP